MSDQPNQFPFADGGEVEFKPGDEPVLLPAGWDVEGVKVDARDWDNTLRTFTHACETLNQSFRSLAKAFDGFYIELGRAARVKLAQHFFYQAVAGFPFASWLPAGNRWRWMVNVTGPVPMDGVSCRVRVRVRMSTVVDESSRVAMSDGIHVDAAFGEPSPTSVYSGAIDLYQYGSDPFVVRILPPEQQTGIVTLHFTREQLMAELERRFRQPEFFTKE